LNFKSIKIDFFYCFYSQSNYFFKNSIIYIVRVSIKDGYVFKFIFKNVMLAFCQFDKKMTKMNTISQDRKIKYFNLSHRFFFDVLKVKFLSPFIEK